MISYLPVISSVTIPSIPFQSGLDVLIDVHDRVLQELPTKGWLFKNPNAPYFSNRSIVSGAAILCLRRYSSIQKTLNLTVSDIIMPPPAIRVPRGARPSTVATAGGGCNAMPRTIRSEGIRKLWIS